jgi:hypothetical protein
MLIGYFQGSLAFGISTNSGSAAYLTDSSALADGRSGSGATFSFSSGSAATTQYTSLDVTMTSSLDATPPWGVVGLVNVQGLPENTKCTFNGVTQKLTRDAWGELSAWWLPSAVTGASESIRIYNDVNGSHSITPGATCFVGEIFAGRILSLPTLVYDSPPASDLQDPTAFQRSSGAQLRQLMRYPFDLVSAKVGRFSTSDYSGGSLSSIVSGANPAGVIDLRTFRRLLSTLPVCAVCDVPSAGQGDGSGTPRYSQAWITRNFMLARPINIGQIAMDTAPLWSWSGLQFQRAS